MKKITATLFIAYVFTVHHHASGMLIIRSLSKSPKTKKFLCQKNDRTPWTKDDWGNKRRLTYETECLRPLFEAYEELYQTTTKNHDELTALLKQLLKNQKNIMERLDLLEEKEKTYDSDDADHPYFHLLVNPFKKE